MRGRSSPKMAVALAAVAGLATRGIEITQVWEDIEITQVWEDEADLIEVPQTPRYVAPVEPEPRPARVDQPRIDAALAKRERRAAKRLRESQAR